MADKITIKNKKATLNFQILERYTAGIQLTGTEIKAIRQGKANLVDTYCYFDMHELWLRGLHISEYSHGNLNNHDPKRDRKLLLRRQELKKLEKKFNEKGITIIALKLFINDRGIAKIEIGLAEGKKKYDKRADMKEKELKRDLDRIQKHRIKPDL